MERREVLHIEDISRAYMRRKTDTVRIFVDALYDFNWTNLTSMKLVVFPLRKTILSEINPDLISGIKTKLVSLHISRGFVFGSGLLQVRLSLAVELLQVCHEIDSFTMVTSLIWDGRKIQRAPRNRPVNYLKRTESQASVKGVVVRKFSLTKLSIPRLDIVSNKTTQQIP